MCGLRLDESVNFPTFFTGFQDQARPHLNRFSVGYAAHGTYIDSHAMDAQHV